jgi:hypothetical protein
MYALLAIETWVAICAFLLSLEAHEQMPRKAGKDYSTPD